MNRTKITALALLAVISIFTPVHADDISLPLGGYFHPGRAMPVRWNVSPSAAIGSSLQLFASDAITSRLIWSGNPRGILPWIPVDANVDTLHWRAPSGTAGEISGLHPMDDSDFLVGVALPENSDIGALFPNRRIITIHLNPEDLTAPAMAWETLDAMLVSPDEWQKLSLAVRDDLFAEGITLAIPAGARPDSQLPWAHYGPWWIASAKLKLPPMIDSDAYAPTAGWTAGRTQAFRRRIFLFGAIYCLIACGVGLWRSRWMPAGFVAISMIAATAFSLDNFRQSPIFHRGGIVRLNAEITFEDDWLYQVSHRAADFRLPVDALVQPIFTDKSQVGLMNLTLDCDGHGQPIAIDGHLPSDEPLALMTRQITADRAEDSTISSPTSPLRLLDTDSIYPQFRIVGQIASSTEEDIWPAMVFARP